MIAFCQYLIHLPGWKIANIPSPSHLLSPPQLLSWEAESFISQLRHCVSPHKTTCLLPRWLLLPDGAHRASKVSDRDTVLVWMLMASEMLRNQWGAEKWGTGNFPLLIYKQSGWDAVRKMLWIAKILQLQWKRRVILCQPSKHVSITVEHLDQHRILASLSVQMAREKGIHIGYGGEKIWHCA